MGGESAQKRDLKVTELLERGFASLPPLEAIPIGSGGVPNPPGKADPIQIGTPAAAAPPSASPDAGLEVKLNIPLKR